MLEAKFQYVWQVYKGQNFNHIDEPGRWSLVYAGGADASELTDFLAVDLEYRRDGVQECVNSCRSNSKVVTSPGLVLKRRV